tara:strand:- start:1219 stop:2271 length:1053 start_codon:yes stop_codon:yes gene_type:complete
MGNSESIIDEKKNLVKSSYRPLPLDFFERPVLLIDSGQSVGESVFLEKFREYIYTILAKTSNRGNKPSVWMVYPDRRLWARYGSSPVSGFEEWEIRPIRRNADLSPGGYMETVAKFEDSCHFLGIDAPWRTFGKKKRASAVYLNPTERDVRWIQKNHSRFKRHYNLPKFHTGQPADRKLPFGVTQFSDLIWCYDRQARDKLADAFSPYYSKRIPWERFWKKDRNPAYQAVAAPDWRDKSVIRHQSAAKCWGEAMGMDTEIVENGGRWEDFLLGTSCSMYIIATTREHIPYDAFAALARGATLVAPDVPAFQNLHGKKILYPAKMVGDGIVWSQSEVEHYLTGKKHGLDNN